MKFLLAYFLVFLSFSSPDQQTMEAKTGSNILPTDTCIHLNAEEFFLSINLALLPLVIDTRTWEEYRKERIRGAHLAEDRAELIRLTDSLDLDHPIFLYCENNDRSPVACGILSALGYRRVYNLSGGLLSWKEIDYETDRRRYRRRQ